MVLKEAFHYQNYLTDMINQALDYLSREDFITTKTEIHKRTEVYSEGKDETIHIDHGYDKNITPEKMVDFIVSAIDEKEKMSNAINKAKANASRDVDTSLETNRIKREYIRVLHRMSQQKASETTRYGTGYKFDNDGKQAGYMYPIQETTKINFNRNNIRKLLSKYRSETATVSNECEKIFILTDVDYQPKFDVDTPLEDIITEE